jgi:HPr kinase/phosphorylase
VIDDRPRFHVDLGDPLPPPTAFEVMSIGSARFRLTLPGEAVCDVDLHQGRVLLRPAHGVSGPALGHLIADHVLARIAGERMFCLHAAAVAVDRRAYVLIGPSGAGKSTLALRAVLDGGELLGDDCAAIQGGRVLPTYRAARVWPEALPVVGLPDAPVDGSGKVCLKAEHGVRVAETSSPLAGIILVGTQPSRLGLHQALPLLAGHRFHLGGRPPWRFVDEVLDVLDRYGPLNEVDRERWLPPRGGAP